MLRRISAYLLGLFAILSMLIVPALPHHHHEGEVVLALWGASQEGHTGCEHPGTEHHSTPCHHNQGIQGEMPQRVSSQLPQKSPQRNTDQRVCTSFFRISEAVFASEIGSSQTSRGAPTPFLPPDGVRCAQGLRAPPTV